MENRAKTKKVCLKLKNFYYFNWIEKSLSFFFKGMIDLVLTFTSASSLAARPIQHQQPVVFVPNVSGRALPVYIQPQVQPPPIQPLTEKEIVELMEIFPTIDRDVIKSIGENNRGNKEATINSLLQLTC